MKYHQNDTDDSQLCLQLLSDPKNTVNRSLEAGMGCMRTKKLKFKLDKIGMP